MKQSDLIRVPAFELPRSSSLMATQRSGPPERERSPEQDGRVAAPAGPVPPPPPYDDANAEAVLTYRQWINEKFYPRIISKQRQQYDVQIEPREIAGVYTEVITPADGVPYQNRNRLLLNLHAGGFTFGARLCGQIESIPIASLGQREVISVDYRLAPEHQHPAAVDDLIAVYKKIIESDAPLDIAIFGYSAGALLAAQAIARMQQESLPMPSAVAMLFGGAIFWGEGDSAHWAPAIAGNPPPQWKNHLYLKGIDPDDPGVFPLRSTDILARFPPSLLVSATRDFALSSVVHTHSTLARLGVETQLYIWEGIGHAFSHDFRLPQSRELYDILLRFFDKHRSKGSA
jgi:epsilon-lactone hydrolase